MFLEKNFYIHFYKITKKLIKKPKNVEKFCKIFPNSLQIIEKAIFILECFFFLNIFALVFLYTYLSEFFRLWKNAILILIKKMISRIRTFKILYF